MQRLRCGSAFLDETKSNVQQSPNRYAVGWLSSSIYALYGTGSRCIHSKESTAQLLLLNSAMHKPHKIKWSLLPPRLR